MMFLLSTLSNCLLDDSLWILHFPEQHFRTAPDSCFCQDKVESQPRYQLGVQKRSPKKFLNLLSVHYCLNCLEHLVKRKWKIHLTWQDSLIHLFLHIHRVKHHLNFQSIQLHLILGYPHSLFAEYWTAQTSSILTRSRKFKKTRDNSFLQTPSKSLTGK